VAGLTIGKFAAAGGRRRDRALLSGQGLLALPERLASGYREYTEADRWRLAFIGRARRLGFTLGDIADLLGPAGAKFGAIDKQIGELALIRCRLRRHHPER